MPLRLWVMAQMIILWTAATVFPALRWTTRVNHRFLVWMNSRNGERGITLMLTTLLGITSDVDDELYFMLLGFVSSVHLGEFSTGTDSILR